MSKSKVEEIVEDLVETSCFKSPAIIGYGSTARNRRIALTKLTNQQREKVISLLSSLNQEISFKQIGEDIFIQSREGYRLSNRIIQRIGEAMENYFSFVVHNSIEGYVIYIETSANVFLSQDKCTLLGLRMYKREDWMRAESKRYISNKDLFLTLVDKFTRDIVLAFSCRADITYHVPANGKQLLIYNSDLTHAKELLRYIILSYP